MNKRVFALILCMALLLFGAGCAASGNSSMKAEAPAAMPAPQAAPGGGWANATYDMAEITSYPEEAMAADSLAGEMGSDASNRTDGGATGVKIIKNANISLETKNFDANIAHIRTRTEEMGGYISSSYVSGKEPENYYDSGRYASIVARIPQERLETFLADTRDLATVISESMSGDDITANYRDTESRLEVYSTQRERILELLKQAENMEDIITLETELSRLTYEIEQLTGSLRRWDDLVSYSTVTIDIREIPPSTPITGEDSMGIRIGDGLRRTLNGMAVFFENLLVFLVVSSPVLLLFLIIGVIVFMIVRRYGRKQKERMATQQYAPVTSAYGNGKTEKKKPKRNKRKEAPTLPEGEKQDE